MITTVMLIALVGLAIHRIWIYEDIFRPLRARIDKTLSARAWTKAVLLKPISCSPCFGMWAAGLATAGVIYGMEVRGLREVVLALAAFPVVRAATWVYHHGIPLLQAGVLPTRHVPGELISQTTIQPPAKAGCSTCGTSVKVPAPVPTQRKVILMTVFSSFDKAYSLVGVVLDQARALAQQGHKVEIWCNTHVAWHEYPREEFARIGIDLKTVFPQVTWKEDEVSEGDARLLAQTLERELPTDEATIITHDLQFLTWYVSFAKALRLIKPRVNLRWYHQAHSAPSVTRMTTDAGILRQSLPEGHRLLVLSNEHRARFAALYQIGVDMVHVVPNVRDIMVQNRWTEQAREIATQHQLLKADLVQVFPISLPRWRAKGVDKILYTMGELKKAGNSVRLVLVTAHAGAMTSDLREIHDMIAAAGLAEEDVVVTAEAYPKTLNGVDGDVVADLMQVSNLFIFPTVSEGCSLILLEAAINGCLLVLNSRVGSMYDVVTPDEAIYTAFESPEEVAGQILQALPHDKAGKAKREVLRRFSSEAIGEQLHALVR